MRAWRAAFWCSAVVISLVCLGLWLANRPEPRPVQPLELVLELATGRIRQLDPLIVKVSLRNNTAQPFALEYDARGGGWEVPLQLRCTRTVESATITGRGGAFNCFVDTKQPVIIPPGGRYVTYEQIFWGGAGWQFPEAGDYQLRARFDLGERTLWSNTAVLRVNPIPDSERQLIVTGGQIRHGADTSESVVLQLLATGVDFVEPDALIHESGSPVAAARAARLALIETQLPPCYLRKTLEWKRTVLAVGEAPTDERRSQARQKLGELRQQLDPVTNEVIDLALGVSYRDSERWAELAALLDAIKEPSQRVSELRDTLQRHQQEVKAQQERERALAAMFPDDERLDSKIVYQIRTATFAEILGLLSKQGNVHLNAEDEFKRFTTTGRWIGPHALRSEMYDWAYQFKGTWQRRGDGYYLTAAKPAPADAGKP